MFLISKCTSHMLITLYGIVLFPEPTVSSVARLGMLLENV